MQRADGGGEACERRTEDDARGDGRSAGARAVGTGQEWTAAECRPHHTPTGSTALNLLAAKVEEWHEA